MKIFIGADHRGYDCKARLVKYISQIGHDVEDLGTHQKGVDCDFPEIGYQVAYSTIKNAGARGILICMTGFGQCIVANKVPGVQAALCLNKEMAVFARQHNNSNVLVLSAKYVSEEDMPGIVSVWLETAFEGGRHARRLSQIREIETRILKEFKS